MSDAAVVSTTSSSGNSTPCKVRRTALLPRYDVNRYLTKFGGEREDVVVLTFPELPTGLPNAIALQDLVENALPQLSFHDLSTLVELGSVYVSHIQLRETDHRDQSTLTSRARGRNANRAKFRGKNGASHTAPLLTHRLQKNSAQPSTSCDLLLPKATTSVRLHLTPQRFPIASRLLWDKRLRFSSTSFVLVDKPGGLPCEPVASNYTECLHVQAGQALFSYPLLPLNRIDLWTTGLVCLARNREAVRRYHAWQQAKRILKTYRLLVFAGPSENVYDLLHFSDKNHSVLEHWMPGGTVFGLTAPRLVSRVPIPGWKHCLSHVVHVADYHFDNALAQCEGETLGYSGAIERELTRLQTSGYRLYDITVELVTGRTHQLRAQFSAIGLPIVNDTMYYPLRGIYADLFSADRVTQGLDLSALVLDTVSNDTANLEALPSALSKLEEILLHLLRQTRKPSCPLGLQAHSLRLLDSPDDQTEWSYVTAGQPWWVGGFY